MGTCKNMVIRTSSQREKRRVHAINCALVNYKKFQNTVSAVEISRNCSLFFFPPFMSDFERLQIIGNNYLICTWTSHIYKKYCMFRYDIICFIKSGKRIFDRESKTFPRTTLASLVLSFLNDISTRTHDENF